MTKINYSIKNASLVTLKVYDVSGREILVLVNEFQNFGRYSVNFNGSNFASGIYYYKIFARDFESFRKMLLLK